jgi:integrase
VNKRIPGVRERSGGRLGYVRVRGTLYRKQFPAGTPTSEILAWQEQQRTAAAPVAAPSGSFAADVADYLTRITALASYRQRRTDLHVWIAELGGDRARHTITPTELDQCIQRWLVTATTPAPGKRGRPSDPDGLGAGTIRNRLKALSAFYGVMDGKHAANPVRGCHPPRPVKPEARGLDYATIARILRAMPEPPDSCAQVRAALVAYTGLPPATVKRLAPADVVRDAGGVPVALRLRARKKGGGVEARTIPLTGPGATAMQAFDAAHAYGAFNTSALNAAFKRAAARVGVPVGAIRLYDLRHSFGTELYKQTKDLATVARMMQHAQGSPLTSRYSLGAHDDVDRAAAAAFLATPASTPAAKSSHRKFPRTAKVHALSKLEASR